MQIGAIRVPLRLGENIRHELRDPARGHHDPVRVPEKWHTTSDGREWRRAHPVRGGEEGSIQRLAVAFDAEGQHHDEEHRDGPQVGRCLLYTSQHSVFPDLFANLYSSGEVSGKLDETLKRLYAHYQEEGTHKPVSYTHLDVYKRQHST